MARLLTSIACALTLSFGASGASAQSRTAITLSHDEWTALTMAPDGSWGVATDLFVNRAIAEAIHMCRGMSGQHLGCGAALVTVQAGWSLGIRCGQENILVADRYLEKAETIARERELALRYVYRRELGSCRRAVTVDPQGRVIVPEQEPRIALPDERASGR